MLRLRTNLFYYYYYHILSLLLLSLLLLLLLLLLISLLLLLTICIYPYRNHSSEVEISICGMIINNIVIHNTPSVWKVSGRMNLTTYITDLAARGKGLMQYRSPSQTNYCWRAQRERAQVIEGARALLRPAPCCALLPKFGGLPTPDNLSRKGNCLFI